MRRPRLGTVISGTLRLEDLLRAFADEVERLDSAGRYTEAVKASRAVRIDLDDASESLAELDEALHQFAPPYCYFGAHPGDGADFGFWPDWDAIDADRRDGALPAGDALPADGSAAGYYLHISDHGNAELYEWDAAHRRWNSVWGVV